MRVLGSGPEQLAGRAYDALEKKTGCLVRTAIGSHQPHDHQRHHGADNQLHTSPPSLNATALRATFHCLTGCSIGEVLGMVIGTGMHWPNAPTVAVSIVLAFIFGYSMTLSPLLRAGLTLGIALKLALAADTLSIAVMEVVDNGFMLVVPGAMDAHLDTALFRLSLAGSLVLAGVLAFPVNRWLIGMGKGHAVMHRRHLH